MGISTIIDELMIFVWKNMAKAKNSTNVSTKS